MTPEAYNAEILRELKQIRSDVSELKGMVLVISGGKKGGGSASNGGASSGSSRSEGEVASDRELDSQYGNQPIRKDPSEKYWSGDSFMTCCLSETTPEYLDAYAKWKEASAYMKNKDANDPSRSSDDREKAKKYAGYDSKDARLARGWAARLRNGWNGGNGAAPSNGGGDGGAQPDQFSNDDDIPFVCEESRWWMP